MNEPPEAGDRAGRVMTGRPHRPMVSVLTGVTEENQKDTGEEGFTARVGGTPRFTQKCWWAPEVVVG